MCDSTSTSDILTGDTSFTSAPPLILLQSEEDSGAGDKSAGSVDTVSIDAGVVAPAGNSSHSSVPDTTASGPAHAWESTEPANSASTTSALSDAWNLDHVLTEDKNPFSGLTEEHLSRLDDVLSSEEVRNFLQQTNLSELDAGLVADSVALPSSSSSSTEASQAKASPLPSQPLKLDLFDSQASDSSEHIDHALAHHFIQDSVREHELAVMAAAFNDHAYALPLANNDTASLFCPPRKSARIKKNAFDSDSDFEYYLTPKRNAKKDQLDQSDGSSPAPGSPAPSTSSTQLKQPKQPKRRSTRIVDLENREKAEKILQENRQQELEAKVALQKQQEDEAKDKDVETQKESTPPQPAKRGKKQTKKGLGAKGKKGKPEEAEEQQEAEDSHEGEDSTKPPSDKPSTKASPTLAKGKAAKKANEAETTEGKGKQKTKTEAEGEEVKPVKKQRGRPRKKKAVEETDKIVPNQKAQESSDEDDEIPLKAIANTHKSTGKAEDDQPTPKPKKKKLVKALLASAEKGTPGEKKLVTNQLKMTSDQAKTATHEKKTSADQKKVAPGLKKVAAEETKVDSGLKKVTMGLKKVVSDLRKGIAGHKKMIPGQKKVLGLKKGVPGQKKLLPGLKKGMPGTKKGIPGPKKVVLKDDRQRSVSVSSEGKNSSSHGEKKKEVDRSSTDRRLSKGENEASSKGGEKITDKVKAAGAGTGKTEEATTTPTIKHPKHKHRKSEEIIIDPTVTDLFKPDGVIPTEQYPRKESEAAAELGKDSTPGSAHLGHVHHTPAAKHVTSESHHSHSGHMADSKNGSSLNKRSLSAESPRSCGDAGPDKKASGSQHGSGLGKQHGSGSGSVKQEASSSTSHHAGPGDRRQSSPAVTTTTAATPSSKMVPGKHIYVKIKSEKDSDKTVTPQKGHRLSSDGHSHHKHAETQPKVEEKSHSAHAEELKQPKEERKSLFEVLSKPHVTAEDHKDSKPSVSAEEHKESPLERKDSVEKKHRHKERRGSKGDGNESGDLSYEDDEKDSDWEPASDADTLYCFCKKPHGNRFMICCDGCGEWYHGQCVGVSKQQGQKMEEENKDYICSACSGSPLPDSKLVKERREKGKSVERKKPPGGMTTKQGTVSLVDPKVLSKIKSGKDKWKTHRCIMADCKRSARLGSVFCGNSCLMRHARESLRLLRSEREKKSGLKITDARPSETEHVVVMERRSGKVLSGSSAPTEAQLELWLQAHPSYEVVQPSVSSSSSFYGKKKDRRSSHGSGSTPVRKTEEKPGGGSAVKKEEGKEEDILSTKSGKSDEGLDNVRFNVRKSLRDALSQRAEEADDIVMSGSEIKRLALRIEEELFKVYRDTGHKYRAKFRSLLFNIKDPKNKGLFRKILMRKIRSSHLVKMSTEELASKELSRWRKMETKHTLEMIEQMEKEAMKEGQHHIRKKTHKGEVEVQDEDMSTLVTHVEEPKSKTEQKTEEAAPVAIVDTTDQHRAHLFDLNCKICTGKMLPPTTEESPAPKVKVAHKVKEERKEDSKKEHTKKSKGVTIIEEKEVKEEAEEEEETPEEVVQHVLEHMQAEDAEAEAALAARQAATTSKVTVRSPDSALQSGLEPKHKYLPSGPMVWKGFISMQDFAKFFTSAYRVSGPVSNLDLPDTLQICGRIGPDQMWDYLGKIRQAGSRDICILRFIPGSDDEKVAYVHLYSYLNSRSRCGVVGNAPKHVKDLYIVPLASHGKISQVLLPFDGPGLEGNRPHMLIGIVVRQKAKRPAESLDTSKGGKPGTGRSVGVSSAKKLRPSKDEETEAYSPTADGEEVSGAEALYIPTPTTSHALAASSGSSSSSSTPSSSIPGIGRDGAGKRQSPPEDIEPYSPSKAMEVDEEELPYDPEDAGQFDDEAKVSTAVPTKVVAEASKGAAGATDPAPAVVSTVPTTPVTTTPTTTSSTSSSAPVSSTVAVDIDNVMVKISASTNPEEISSLMVGMLATAKDAAEQQRLLATLTARVEQQKKLKASKQTQDSSDADGKPETGDSAPTPGADSKPGQEEAVPSHSVTASSAILPPISLSSTAHSDIKAAIAALTASAQLSSSTVLSVVSSSSPSSTSTSTSAAASTLAEGILSTGVTSTSSAAGSKSAESVSRISSLTPETENMPLALKALMEELKGNTQMARAVDIRTERERREAEKREATGKEADADKAQSSSGEKLQQADKSDSVIPGLGGAKDEPVAEVEEVSKVSQVSAEAKDKCDEVTSSTDSQKDKHKSSEEGLVTSSSITGHSGQFGTVTEPGLEKDHATPLASKERVPAPASKEQALAAQDRDDRRIPPHPSLPVPVPPPSVTAAYPLPPPLPQPPFMLPSHPLAHPALDVSDVDHRRPGPPPPPPPMYTRMGMKPPGYPPHASLQPPPPGTEVTEDRDIDMRQTSKRCAPLPVAHPPEKLPRPDVAVSSHPPPLPPLPPQPPPPLPPLPSSSGSGGDKGSLAKGDHYERAAGTRHPHTQDQWRRSQEGGHDYDHRRHHQHHHHDPYSQFSRGTHHHHHHSHHSRSSSPSSRYRHGGQDRDERHRRDHHFHRDRH